jgi:hypothetical protein
MKHIVGTMGLLLVGSFLGGCSSQSAQAKTPTDVVGRLKTELSHSLAQVDTFDAMNDELAHAIGTTTLTSETVVAPMPLPESRMSLAAGTKPAVQTWGVSELVSIDAGEDEAVLSEMTAGIPDLDDVPNTRE